MKNADLPAMPFVEPNAACSVNSGLTKREMFAMAAMQGLCAAHDQYGRWSHDCECIAATAVAYADAVLFELDK